MHSNDYTIDKWRSICVEKLQNKLSQNLAKRKKHFEDVVTRATHKILREITFNQPNVINIESNPIGFKISDTITNEAFNRMSEIISSWPGVPSAQSKKLPPIFKKYWRIADNWWNRQKGKWFGDLFFWPILNYSLHEYCKKMTYTQIEYDYLYYIYLHDILHSKVSFKKSRPNPLIFDLALEKSPKLQQWFSSAGDRHKVVWEITSNKSIKHYAQNWVKTVKDNKFSIYCDLGVKKCIKYHEPLVTGYWRILNENYSITSYSIIDFVHLCFMYYFDQTSKNTMECIMDLPSDTAYLTQRYMKHIHNIRFYNPYINCIGGDWRRPACTTVHFILNAANYSNSSTEAKCMLCNTNMCLTCKERAHFPLMCDDTSSTKAQCGSDCDSGTFNFPMFQNELENEYNAYNLLNL
eukprot:125833_1